MRRVRERDRRSQRERKYERCVGGEGNDWMTLHPFFFIWCTYTLSAAVIAAVSFPCLRDAASVCILDSSSR